MAGKKKTVGNQADARSEEQAETTKREMDLKRRVMEPGKKGGKKAGTPSAVRPNVDRTGGRSSRKAAKSRGRRTR